MDNPGGCGRGSRPHVGRASEIAQVTAAVNASKGAGVILAGPAGVGKSHVLERAAANLQLQGWTPLRAAGAPTRDTAFGSLAGLVPVTSDDPHRFALVLRRSLDRLIGTAGDGGRPVLVLDDLHAFDAASATFVQHAVLDGRLRVIATLRAGAAAPDAVTGLWKDELIERIDLPPLGRTDTEELAERIMCGPVELASRSRLWELTLGNPLLLTELVAQARERGRWRRIAGTWVLEDHPTDEPLRPPSLDAVLADRMSNLPAPVTEVVDALALADHLPLAVLDRFAGHKVLAQAERCRLTRFSQHAGEWVLTLDHPLYAEILRADLDATRRAELRERLLDVFERLGRVTYADVPLLARWYMESNRSGPRAVDLLTRAAELAWAGDDPHAAAELAGRARELGPNDRNGIIYVTSQAQVMFHGDRDADAAEGLLLEAAAAAAAEDQRQVLLQQAGLLRLLRGDLDGAEMLAGSTLTAPIQLLRGQVDGLPAAGAGGEQFSQVASWLESDQLCQGEGLTSRSSHRPEAALEPALEPFMALRGARMARLRGRAQSAARLFHEAAAGFAALQQPGFEVWALAGLVEMHAHLANRAEASESARRCRSHKDHPVGLGAGEVERSLAWELVSNDLLDDVPEALDAAAQRSLEADEVLHAAHALHDLVRLGHAARARAGLEKLAAHSDAQLVAVFADHAAASDDENAEELEIVANRLDTLGCELLAAETWCEVAVLAASARRVAAARRHALHLRRRCERAVTPRLRWLDGATADLSRRERQIAHLSRAGLRRREIAEHLVISPRTVDSHLQRIYRKLGVANRHDLIGILPEPDRD